MRKLGLLFMLIITVSCGNGDDGSNGINGVDGLPGEAGEDGLSYYSYEVRGNLQEIIGDGRTEELEVSEGDIYQLPKSFKLNVDNPYPDCKLRDVEVTIETENTDYTFGFQPTENRYKMKYKSGPLKKVIDSSYIKVYYKNRPEVDCGSTIHRLHSGLEFNIRVFKKIEFEE